ncbi:MAG TPA: DUF4258 domain-containing protein [Smithellaceae bacterium]|nr:DUF4258 domain-containing protein [Smithellaceae bacterium]
MQECFRCNKVLYTKHARDEMEHEEYGEIFHYEVSQVVTFGKIIEEYSDDAPYPSCLIYGTTENGRPLHVVCAYSDEENLTIIITVYQPDPRKWMNYERRKK